MHMIVKPPLDAGYNSSNLTLGTRVDVEYLKSLVDICMSCPINNHNGVVKNVAPGDKLRRGLRILIF